MSPAIHPCAGVLGSLATWVSGARVRWQARHAFARPRVYFANHSSHLDALVVWAALPEAVRAQTRPVAAQEYWQKNSLRWYVANRIFRSVLVPRLAGAAFAGRRVLAPLVDAIDRGFSLILFPEGTRGDGHDVGEFKGGLYQLCRERPELEAVPVYLENLHRVLPKGEFLPLPGECRVIFGAPLRLCSGENKWEFLERARGALRELREG